MPIGLGDQFKIVCFLGGIFEEEAFVKAIHAEQEDAGVKHTLTRHLRQLRRWWFEGRRRKFDNDILVMNALNRDWPEGLMKPEQLLEQRELVPAFLERCKLRFSQVEEFLSDDAKAEWLNRHYRLKFMKTLDRLSSTSSADTFLQSMIGTYRLYRRHSIVPGVLREYFVITEHADGHCEGKYVQYCRGGGPNIIPFNVFYCGFYVIAFGAHQASGGRTEIITVSVLISQSLYDNAPVECDSDSRRFIGLLSGIYDSGEVLLSERVLIEKLYNIAKPIETASRYRPYHLRGDSRHFKDEYKQVIDIVDNALDGNTLTARSARLEEAME